MPVSDRPPAAAKTTTPRMAQGKRLLMDAAVRLASRLSCAQSVSLRELAREAGLNHNTFYRHFSSQDALLEEIVSDFGQQLRQGLTQARLTAPSLMEVTPTVVGWTLDFALAHQDVFTVAMRERFGPPGPIRHAIEAMLQQLQDDMLAELQARGALPALPEATLRPILAIIIDQIFKMCHEHIEAPEHRAQRLLDAKAMFETLMIGAVTRQAMSTPAANQTDMPPEKTQAKRTQ
ncbi:MAG TPA: TetR family transcriptional regulator [Aquabacterium sp.]|uniref:TetR/AcrR family transcriptional regulator n=1 Tax=Aquabacterium sp. TaxID=1872578 RepID=UPI002E349065|nr:TetR family transcriptional regulator [Aquabacterium sp.]HEX5355275.1 TetR family transcriptional regulator [Aquabacterium sp.]